MSKTSWDPQKTIFLVDGSGYIFRAFFAIRHLRNKNNLPTNAIFGFTKMLLRLMKDHDPQYLAIAFDNKEKNFRHEIYPDYKAHRPQPHEDLVVQFPYIPKMVEALNIPQFSLKGYEADDILGSLCKQAKEQGFKVVIVTGDKDLMQLVDDDVMLFDEMRAMRGNNGKFIDKDGVKEQIGVWPSQVVDLLALAGDSSDNVPGVKGIGMKTAQDLLNEYKTLENLYDKTPLITQKAKKEKLLSDRDNAFLSKKLVGIAKDAMPVMDFSNLKIKTPDKEALNELLTLLDFHSLKKDFGLDGQVGENSKKEENALENILVVKEKEHWNKALAILEKADTFAFHLHTDGGNYMNAKVLGIAVFLGAPYNQSFYFSLEEKEFELQQHNLKEIFAAAQKKPKIFICHDFKYQWEVLFNHGVLLNTNFFDPMIASYLLYQDEQKHDVKTIFDKILKISNENSHDTPNAQCLIANGMFLAKEIFETTLKKENLWELYETIEMPLTKVLAQVEINGVKVDRLRLNELSLEMSKKLCQLEKDAVEQTGVEFNLASPKQVADVLFGKLQLNNVKKTKTGFSTDANVLAKLQGAHPVIDTILAHRMYAKLLSTYVEVLPKLINEKTQRIHAKFNQCVAATGRLSSSDPNLQNIPVKTKEGQKIRHAFVPEDGCSLISLDYSQMELRLLAYASKDENLVKAFKEDLDIHQSVASEIFDVALEQVTKEQRGVAKTINFGLLYGMGSVKLAQTLGIKRNVAADYLKTYFEKYSGILLWKEKTLKEAKESLQVRTFFNRKRSIKDMVSANPMLKARAERIAINAPIQGSAADIIKITMVKTFDYLKTHYPQAKLILQVHDELVIECPENDAKDIAVNVQRIMSKDHGLDLFLKVDYAIGQSWGEAK